MYYEVKGNEFIHFLIYRLLKFQNWRQFNMSFCLNCGEELVENTDTCIFCGHVTSKATEKNNPKYHKLYVILGFLFAFTAILVIPPVIGGLGIWLGTIVSKKVSAKLGLAIIIVNVVTMIVGIYLNILMLFG